MSRSLAIVMLGVFICSCGSKRAADRSGEAWLASYVGERRVGYSVYRYERNADGYRFDNYIRMTLEMAGKVQRVHSRAVINTGADYGLRDFDFSFDSQDRSFSVKGRVEDGKLIVIPRGGQARQRAVEGQIFPLAAIGRMMVTADLRKDSLFRLPVFDVSVLDVATAEVRVLGREDVRVGDSTYSALKLSTKVGKIPMLVWVDAQGMVLREESPPSMHSERSTAKEILASEEDDGKVDILEMFRVPVDTVIPEPDLVRRARLQLSGVEPGEYDLDYGYQKVVGTSPLIVELDIPEPTAKPLTLPVVGQEEFLSPSVSIQSDDPRIRAKASEALGQVGDATEAARKLVSWVFTVIDKEATASYPTALDVLQNMKGDCNEHSVFYAALARSVGLPAKVAVGLVYLNGAFYYHAWNEVYLGGWVPVDATFGEFPAGALRLKLAEGELSRQADVLAVVGRIGIKILSYSAPPPTQ